MKDYNPGRDVRECLSTRLTPCGRRAGKMERVRHRRLFCASLILASLGVIACPEGVFAREGEATILAKPPSDSEWEQQWQERWKERQKQDREQEQELGQWREREQQRDREQSWEHAVRIVYVSADSISWLILALTGLLIGQYKGRAMAGLRMGTTGRPARMVDRGSWSQPAAQVPTLWGCRGARSIQVQELLL